MIVAAIQADLAWCDQESNRVNLWKQMKDAGQCDLYVLPEMFSTGFCTNDKSMAEPLNADGTCASLDWMIKCSNELDAAIVGSVALSTREGCKNRLYFVRPDGSFEYYMSEPIVEDDAKGVGPLLLAYTEMRRLDD